MLSARAKRRRLTRGDERYVARENKRATVARTAAAQVPVASQPLSRILGKCGHCGAEVEASSLRDGRCLPCRVGDASTAHRNEYVRLRRKQNALRAQGHESAGTDEQVGRCLKRMWRGIQELVPDRKLASTLMEKAMREFEASVMSSRGLYVPEAALRKTHPLSRGIEIASHVGAGR